MPKGKIQKVKFKSLPSSFAIASDDKAQSLGVGRAKAKSDGCKVAGVGKTKTKSYKSKFKSKK